jgi:hypothetical protein
MNSLGEAFELAEAAYLLGGWYAAWRTLAVTDSEGNRALDADGEFAMRCLIARYSREANEPNKKLRLLTMMDEATRRMGEP